MFEFDPDAIVPDKCRDCGVQCEAASRLINLLFMKHAATLAGESLVGDHGQALDAMIDDQAPPEIADEIKRTLREMVGNDLSELDDRIEAEQREIRANELACNGVFKIRASRGDVTYTVSVCTSPRAYHRDGTFPEHLPTHISAESI